MTEKSAGDLLIWDAHACLTLNPDVDILVLDRHRRAGASFVSVNVGMDFNPLEQVMTVLASFNAQLAARPDLFVAVRTAGDVRHARKNGLLGVAFDLEGAVPLCGRPEMAAVFSKLGVRQIHFAYNRDNAVAGGCHGGNIGLTALGREMVAAVNQAGMLMDVSHTGHRSSMEIFEVSAAPVIYSHANPAALVKHPRNIADDQIDACAATGGVICINGVELFLADPALSPETFVDHVAYVAGRVGPEHVGLGLDYAYASPLSEHPPGFDPSQWWPNDLGYPGGLDMGYVAPEQFGAIHTALSTRGFDDSEIAGIMGQNMLRVAGRVWGE
ncbi:MAG: dipeptidase [Alphaproteobacteria bacterium]